MKKKPHLSFDGYKCDHRRQYPENSLLVFSNMTARGTRVKGLNKVIFFLLQAFIKEHLIQEWGDEFFAKDVEKVVADYNRRLKNYLGPNGVGEQHIRDLHALGYLPLQIWALPEGSAVDLRVPMFVMWNTDDKFFWLTNAIETIISANLWGGCTSATTAVMYRQILNEWANKTNPEMIDFVPWQGHDFSFRGHFGFDAAIKSGAAHLLAFTGTDTVPAIDYLEEYYNADSDKELVGGSVSATEHSVMCMGGVEDEVGTFKRIITELYPNGIVSIVSDTWDFWNVVNPDGGICTLLKDKIMARDGKVVIRPDSGDPVKIVTGYTEDEIVRFDGKIYEWHNDDRGKEITELEVKGMVVCLWEIFGGTNTSTGYKQLDSHIGAIYGDSITLERATQICERLAAKGFASTNIVYGIGSFTYQGAITPDAIITRDTHGFAVKSTYGEVLVPFGNDVPDLGEGMNPESILDLYKQGHRYIKFDNEYYQMCINTTGENVVMNKVEGERQGIEIFKDPKTDDGLKKSAKGLIAVYETEDGFTMKDQATWDDVKNCAFVNVFSDGKLMKDWTLAEIRERVAKNF
jgi:nicotinamide phosphoribosyltransferase